MSDPVAVDVRLNLIREIFFAPWQMRSNLADDQEPRICFFSDAYGFGNALSRCHPSYGDEKILRRIIERNFLYLDSVINNRQGFIPEHSGLCPADAHREAAGEVLAIIFVKLFFNISIGDQRGGL